jgi:hypothetical protein
MRPRSSARPRHEYISTAALVVALLALVASLGGGSYAAKLLTGKDIKDNSVTGQDIKNNTVTSKNIKNRSVTGDDIKKSSIEGTHVKDSSLTGSELKDGSVGSADLAAGTLEKKMTTLRVAATSGATFDAARTAAPEHVLFSDAPFTIYAKCFTDASGSGTYAYIYIRTATSGALLDSDESSYSGGAVTDFLNTGTPEVDRALQSVSNGGTNSANYYGQVSGFGAFAADGTAISGLLAVGAKSGTLTGGNGAYGAGDACVFADNIRSN